MTDKISDIDISDIDRIKDMARAGYLYIFVTVLGREGVIVAQKYSPGWWNHATVSDLKRVVVY